MDKTDKQIINSTIFLGVTMLLFGVLIGCLIMTITHRDIYSHYNECQESELIKKLAETNDEKNWYIKEDCTGKLKLIELSQRELDSLNKIK